MRPSRFLAATALLVLNVACGGSGTTATPNPPPTAAATPTAAPRVTQAPKPSFAGDPTLAAAFPTTVAGNPVTGVQTALLLDFFRGLPQATIDQFTQAMTVLGIDAGTMVFGSATAKVNEGSVGILAIRVPGHDANVLIQNYRLITGSSVQQGDTFAQEQSGGKTVTVPRDSGGHASSPLYASGDILWVVRASNADDAAAVFAALP